MNRRDNKVYNEVNNADLDKHYALPIEMATAVTMAWRQTLAATSFIDSLCSDARADAVPQMPTTNVRQDPGPPSDPVRDLVAAIGAVAQILSPKEIREDPEAQKAMDVEYQKLQNGGTWRINDVKP